MHGDNSRRCIVFLCVCVCVFFHRTLEFVFTDNQEKVQSQKQMLAEQRREEARVQKQIEVAHKEMERLEKYVNTSVE